MNRLLTIVCLLAVIHVSTQQCITSTVGFPCSGCHDTMVCDFSTPPASLNLANFPFDIANDLTIENINTAFTISSGFFSSFTSYNATAIADYNIIKISCAAGGSLVLTAGSFQGLEHYRNLRITDCDLNLVDSVFADFTNLTSLAIYGGSITSISSGNVFSGLTMDYTGQVGTGSINITADLPNGTIPSDFFGPVATSLVELRITDNNWDNYHLELLYNVTNLRLLDMSRTENSWVPDPFFDNTPTLSFVYLYGLRWNCECLTNNWLFNWEVTSGVHIESDFICQMPEAEKGKYMRKWKIETCDKQGIGFYLGTYWVGLYQIMLWVLTIVFMIFAIVALVLAKKALKQKPVGGALVKMDAKGKAAKGGAKTAPPPPPSVKKGPPSEGQPPPDYKSEDEGPKTSGPVSTDTSGGAAPGAATGAAAGAVVVTAAVHNPDRPPSGGQRPGSSQRPSSGRPNSGQQRSASPSGEAAPPPAATEAFQDKSRVSGIDRFRKMAAKVRLQKKVVNTWEGEQ